LNLNDGGKTTVSFTSKQLEQIVLSDPTHGHLKNVSDDDPDGTLSDRIKPTSATAYGSWTVTISPSGAYVDDVIKDYNVATYVQLSIDKGPDNKIHQVWANFGSYAGPTPTKVYACLRGTINARTTGLVIMRVNGADVWTHYPGQSGFAGTLRVLLSGTSIPSSVEIYMETGTDHQAMFHTINDIWVDVYSKSTSYQATGIVGAVPNPFAPEVTIDIDGAIDLTGDFGGLNTLIQNPAFVRKHLLVSFLGRSLSEIGSSFATVATTYAGKGYALSFCVEELGYDAAEIFRELDFETRSSMKEERGLFELYYMDIGTPSSWVDVQRGEWVKSGEPVFEMASVLSVRNKIRTRYAMDRTIGNFTKFYEVSDSGSIAKYGALVQDIDLKCITADAVAQDVVAYWLAKWKEPRKRVRLALPPRFRDVERGDILKIFHSFWSEKFWRVLSVMEMAGGTGYEIEAIEVMTGA
jgi:hypothetical protein